MKPQFCKLYVSATPAIFTFAVAAALCQAQNPTVVAYTAPPASAIPRSPDFTRLEVRAVGAAAYSEAAVYAFESSFAGKAGIAAFGLAGPAEVRVTYKKTVKSAEVLPSARKIAASVDGNQITFTVKEPRNLVLNVNGDIDHPLCLFANPIDLNPPSPADPQVDFYAAGQVQQFRKTQKKRIYIEGGAVVKGAIVLGSGTTLSGYGMLLTDINTNPLKSWSARDIAVQGIIVYNFGPGLHKQGNWSYLAYATSNLTVDNVKFFNVFYGEDGIDPNGACHDVTIKNCFFHLGDDCIAIKASSWQSNGNIPHDITVANNVFWQDRYGNPIHIGNETWSTQTLSGLKIVDNYVVRALAEPIQFPRGALISIEAAQGATIDGMLIDGLHIEHADTPRLLNFSVTEHETSKGLGAVRNVTIKNVDVKGPWMPSELAGLDGDHAIENLTLEGLRSNGAELTTPAEAKLHLATFVKHVTVVSGAGGGKVNKTVDGPAPDTAHAVTARPIDLPLTAFKLENTKLTKTAGGLELLADENAPAPGRATAAVPAAKGIVTFKVGVAPCGEKFTYPNFAVFVGNAESGRRVTAFFDPNTSAAAIIQGTPSTRDLERDEKSSGIYFPKGKRTITVTVDIPGKTIHYLVGDWKMSAPFAAGFELDSINIIGLESYRTGATFSDFRFGSLAGGH